MPTTRPYIGAVGIGVADLDRSVDFYTRVVGMKKLTKLRLPEMDEVILSFDGKGAALVVMHYTDGSERNYQGNPVKVVIYTPDPVALAEAVEAEGLEVVRRPAPVPELGDAVVGFVKDPDGYTLELLTS